jgi:hypothetical protein
MNVGSLNYRKGLFRVWVVGSGFWIIGCAVFASDAFDRWHFASTEAEELCEPAPPQLPELPPGFCFDTPEELRLESMAISAWSDLESSLAALSVPLIVLVTSILAWKVSRWVFHGFRQA